MRYFNNNIIIAKPSKYNYLIDNYWKNIKIIAINFFIKKLSISFKNFNSLYIFIFNFYVHFISN